MSTRSAKLPVCASLERLQVAELLRYWPNIQQSGACASPLDAVSSDGFCSMFEPAAGAVAGGPATAALTSPATTSPNACTTVPLDDRPASQVANCCSTVGSTEYVGQDESEPEHTWWNTKGSHPPPCDSAPVTSPCRSARVVPFLIESGV